MYQSLCCSIRLTVLLTAIRYRAGGTVLAGGSSAAPILGRKRRKSFSFKISFLTFSYVHPQIYRPSAGNTALACTMATNSNQRNDSKFNPCAAPILGRNRRKSVVFKRFLLLSTFTQYPQIFRPSAGTAVVINGTTQF